MTHVTSDEAHAIGHMMQMYETVCISLRTLKDDARIASVYALYDCVSLVLARMMKSRVMKDIQLPNAKRLYETTLAVDEDDLNRMFIDFDREYYGKTILGVAMDAVFFDAIQKHLFWRKAKEHLERQSPVTFVTKEESFDAEREQARTQSASSEDSFDPDTLNYTDGSDRHLRV